SWASLAVMAGVPLLVVAKNLGHADTRMVEKHYGHLAPSYIADAIRAGAPRFGDTPITTIPLHSGKSGGIAKSVAHGRTPLPCSTRPTPVSSSVSSPRRR